MIRRGGIFRNRRWSLDLNLGLSINNSNFGKRPCMSSQMAYYPEPTFYLKIMLIIFRDHVTTQERV